MLKKIKKFTASSLLAVLTIWIFSCSEITKKNDEIKITGLVTTASDSSYVKFHRFLNTDATSHFRGYDSVPTINGKFEKTFDSPETTNVIVLASNEHIPSIHIICDGDSEIGVTIERSIPYFDITFTGKNAKGHDLIFDSSLLRVIHLVNVLDESIGQGVDSPAKVITTTERVLDSLFAPFDKLLIKERITTTFHKRVQIQAEGKMLHAIHHIIDHAYRYPKTSALSKAAKDKILKYFFTKYDPFSDRYRYNLGINRTINAENKCRLIGRGLLSGKKLGLDIWGNKYQEYDYAPMELQEKMMATQIILSRTHEEKPICEDLELFYKFKKTFPESAYNIEFQNRYFNRLDCANQSVARAKYPFASMSNDSLTLIVEYGNNNLDSLLQKQFSNKKVFVDLWATWCAPCIQEFGLIDEIKPTLDELGIKQLYISIDRLRARKNWKNAIQSYGLNGSHFLAGHEIDSVLRSKLEKNNELSIPRYLLFDENGKLMDDNLPWPSTGKLIGRLQELCKPKP
ncbi:TlpA family protein disulfide reductase [Maribacter chungangensis]|uniref:TlpA family protein disulfide reductase n=1 Tax=Maribacter chungangensis TaxID=1069117 RepID=A0ABW3B581_9FLAO